MVRFIIAILLALTVASCAGLGALGGGLAGSLGGTLTQVTKEKIAAGAVWRERHRELGNLVLRAYQAEADRRRVAGEADASIDYLLKALEFHETMKPEFLTERIAKRLRERAAIKTTAPDR